MANDAIKTGMGTYADVEANLVEIVKKGFRQEPRLSAKFSDITYENINPTLIAVGKVPAMFIWCDGSEPNSNSLGGLGGRKLSMHETFYATIQFIHSGADERDKNTIVKHAGDVVKEMVYENMDLNGMMNAEGELIELNFLPRPFEVGGKFKMMQGFKLTIKYAKTRKKKRATRR